MRHQRKSLCHQLLVTLTGLFLFCNMGPAPAQTVPEIAEKALAATVYLEMKDSDGLPLGFGSGFFVKPNFIATNYHVIAGAASGTVKLVGKHTTYKIEGFTATDEANDLALLKVSAYGIKPLTLGKSDAVKIGDKVYVAGNPKGLEGTFSDGIISSRRDKYTKERFQMTAPISPGSSGGPVLNKKGEVIGVSFMTLEGGQNLNFAIPSRYLKTLLAQSGRAKSLSRGNHSVSAEIYFARGNTKMSLGQYLAAVSDYDKVIQIKSDAADAYLSRGIAKEMLGQYFAAIKDYDKVIHLKPDYATAYYNRGIAKGKLGQYFAVITDYDRAIRLKPDYATAYLSRGIAKGKLGQHFAAISDYDRTIHLKPDYATAYYNRGIAKGKLGQYFAAITDYDRAIRLKPDYATAYLSRGIAKGKLGQHFAAISDYDRTIHLKPDYATAYYNRGIAKGKLGQHFAAITDFDIVIQLKPDDADAYFIRGFTKSYYLDQYFAAITDFDIVIQLKPNDADAYLFRGIAKRKLGQYFAAITDYDRAIHLKPDYATAYYNRGVAKALLNHRREARQDLRTAWRLAEKTGETDTKALIERALQLLEE